jgi:hypothetical protein
VTFNYRLGALGFLAMGELSRETGHNASGNSGLMGASDRVGHVWRIEGSESIWCVDDHVGTYILKA